MTDEFIFEIMDKFNASKIVDLTLEQNGAHIALRKKEAFIGNDSCIVKKTSESGLIESNADISAQKNQGSAAVSEENNTVKSSEKASADVLKSPIVGTFYRAPSPDSPAYAEKGKKIKKGEPVCIIEAMKMMNTLNADYDFEVLDILVANGDLVEFDQPLFAIKKL